MTASSGLDLLVKSHGFGQKGAPNSSLRVTGRRRALVDVGRLHRTPSGWLFSSRSFPWRSPWATSCLGPEAVTGSVGRTGPGDQTPQKLPVELRNRNCCLVDKTLPWTYSDMTALELFFFRLFLVQGAERSAGPAKVVAERLDPRTGSE